MKKLALKFLYFGGISFILFSWQKNASFSIIAFGRLFGLLGTYLTLVQLLLIGRVKWIEGIFGMDRLTRIHHTHGYYAFTLLVSHFIFITAGYSLSTKNSFLGQVVDFFLNDEHTRDAIIALSLLIFIIFLSVTIVKRKLRYEAWYFVHIFTYATIALAFAHQLDRGADFVQNPLFVIFWYLLYIFVFGNLIFFRFTMPLFNFLKFGFKVGKLRKENGDAISVYITGKDLSRIKIIPGQFMIVRFLDKHRFYEAHPFSVSDYENANYIRLTIKNSGDFTSEIPKIKAGTPVVIDGPHGSFTIQNAAKNKFLLIAGGIGITPIRNILQELLVKGRDVSLLYSAKTQNDFTLKAEIDNLAKEYKFNLFYVVSEDENAPLHGHIDKNMIQKLVKDVESREVYICGPEPMMEALTKDLLALGLESSAIHTERFSF